MPACQAVGTAAARVIYTIGHSTRPAAELIELLRIHGVRTLVDIRTVPRSRRNPQFEQATLRAALAEAGLGYVHLSDLGGLRHPRADSPNTGWRNASFKGYADYMLTSEFQSALGKLLTLADEVGPVAIMCAEAVPWRCHRSLVADALLARGVEVEHIVGPGTPRPHRLTPMARVRGTCLIYPAAAEPL
jgi:uncharacterized protein (DUF488 family)